MSRRHLAVLLCARDEYLHLAPDREQSKLSDPEETGAP